MAATEIVIKSVIKTSRENFQKLAWLLFRTICLFATMSCWHWNSLSKVTVQDCIHVCFYPIHSRKVSQLQAAALFAQFGTLFFSRFSPDVNIRSPGNRNSQADLQRLQTGEKIRLDFPLQRSVSKSTRGWACNKGWGKKEDSLFASDMAVIISWVSLST